MYNFIYNGRKICSLSEKMGSTLPDLREGNTVEINGTSYKIRYRKVILQVPLVGDKTASLKSIEIYLEDIRLDY